jgi:hypothetical protein
MSHFAKLTVRVAAGSLLALGAVSIGRIALAADPNNANNNNRTPVTITHISIEDATSGKSLTSTKGGLGSTGTMGAGMPYAEGSFSSGAYRQKVSSDLRRMHEQAFRDESGTTAASTNVVAATNAVVKAKDSVKAKKDAKNK